ncbi:MAG: S8 family peptidase, partial [Bryobacteraceae bacterium]
MSNTTSHHHTLAYLLFGLLIVSPTQAAPPRNARHMPGQLLIRLHDAGDEAALSRLLGAHGGRQERQFNQIKVRRLRVPEASLDRIQKALEQSGMAAFVEKDYLAEGAAVPNDPSYASQWYLAKINSTMAWDMTKGSSGTVVAVVDSGVDATHPDLAGKVVAGWNFLGANSDTSDVYGHGTAVAGTVAAMTDNLAGISGIAWNNAIMPLVVLNSNNYASYSNIAAAIVWAADHGARAINVSIGGTSASSTLQSAVDYAWNKGAVVFASAMNSSTSTPAYPAACNKVVAVGSTSETDELASFSNYGTWVDLTAPGTNMLTTTRGGGYGYWQGTSFSSPLVTGVAALMWSVNPNLSAASLVNLLQSNAD